MFRIKRSNLLATAARSSSTSLAMTRLFASNLDQFLTTS